MLTNSEIINEVKKRKLLAEVIFQLAETTDEPTYLQNLDDFVLLDELDRRGLIPDEVETSLDDYTDDDIYNEADRRELFPAGPDMCLSDYSDGDIYDEADSRNLLHSNNSAFGGVEQFSDSYKKAVSNLYEAFTSNNQEKTDALLRALFYRVLGRIAA